MKDKLRVIEMKTNSLTMGQNRKPTYKFTILKVPIFLTKTTMNIGENTEFSRNVAVQIVEVHATE